MTEHKPRIEVQGIVCRLQAGDGYKRISGPLKVPMGTVVSIIHTWMKRETTSVTFPRAGHLANLSDWYNPELKLQCLKLINMLNLQFE